MAVQKDGYVCLEFWWLFIMKKLYYLFKFEKHFSTNLKDKFFDYDLDDRPLYYQDLIL